MFLQIPLNISGEAQDSNVKMEMGHFVKTVVKYDGESIRPLLLNKTKYLFFWKTKL